MAKGYKSGGRDIKKGQVLNPNGRPKIPEHLKGDKLTQAKVERIISAFSEMSSADLAIHLMQADTPMIERVIGAIYQKALDKGDFNSLDFIFNRSIGKVTEKIQHSLPEPTIIKRSNGEEIALGSKWTDDDDADD